MGCATVAACAGFGAICGSAPATAATMGVVAVPKMRELGYKDTLSTGTVAAGGTLGILIPPSTPMIVYGIMAEASIGKLFAGGVYVGQKHFARSERRIVRLRRTISLSKNGLLAAERQSAK